MDMQTRYLGLELKNPLIASSSTYTGSVEDIKGLEKAGVSAVVLKSLFEEEILGEANTVIDAGGDANLDHTSRDYIGYYVKQDNVSRYLGMIEKLKREISIPVIASINCATAGEWIEFAKKIENAGADALEVNVFMLPSFTDRKKGEVEQLYFDIATKVSSSVRIPVALKLSSYFTNLASTFIDLSETGIGSLVLFNKFYNPDIDLKKLEMTSSSVYSVPTDIEMPLRWCGILSGKVRCDISATTGIHDGDGLIKVLLAGSKVAQIASTLYIHGFERVGSMLERLESWMKEHRFSKLEDFRGRLSQERIDDPSLYERAQFMKYLSGHVTGKS